MPLVRAGPEPGPGSGSGPTQEREGLVARPAAPAHDVSSGVLALRLFAVAGGASSAAGSAAVEPVYWGAMEPEVDGVVRVLGRTP